MKRLVELPSTLYRLEIYCYTVLSRGLLLADLATNEGIQIMKFVVISMFKLDSNLLFSMY